LMIAVRNQTSVSSKSSLVRLAGVGASLCLLLVSNLFTPHSFAYSSGWGQIYTTSSPSEYVSASLQSTTGTWNATTPTNFQTQNNTATAQFSYSIYDLTSFDMSERNQFAISNSLTTPTFNWNHTFVLSSGGYTFKDICLYSNGFYGIGSISNRTLETIFPNGTISTTSLSSSFSDWLRFVFYYDNQGYYMIAWTLTPYPTTSLAVGNNPTLPSAFQVTNAIPFNVNMTVSFSSSASGNQGLQIQLNSISLSLGETSTYSLSTTTSSSGGFNFLGAITNAFAQGINWISSEVSGFFSWLFTQGFLRLLNALGVGWLLTAFMYFVDAVLVMFAIIEATIPYLGLILLMLNMFYVVKLDFAGLFDFYIAIYNVISNIAEVIVSMVQTIVDFIGSISGSGGGAAMAAAGA
jgi:hypothetical protein